RRVSSVTPFQRVSSLDHLVTQWMSTVTSVAGSAWKAAQVQRPSSRRAESSRTSDHVSGATRGVGPADRTGKSLVTYCPGGIRPGSPPRRLPRKPRVIMLQPPWRSLALAAGSRRHCYPELRRRATRLTRRRWREDSVPAVTHKGHEVPVSRLTATRFGPFS